MIKVNSVKMYVLTDDMAAKACPSGHRSLQSTRVLTKKVDNFVTCQGNLEGD